jgi:hypothetical protein
LNPSLSEARLRNSKPPTALTKTPNSANTGVENGSKR